MRTCWPDAPSTRGASHTVCHARPSSETSSAYSSLASASSQAERIWVGAPRSHSRPPPTSMTLASAESQSLPTGALTPSVTRSGRSVRVLSAGARPVSRLPVPARERQFAQAERAITSSSTRRIADTAWQPKQEPVPPARARGFGGLCPKLARWTATSGSWRGRGERRQRPGDVLPSRLAPEEGFEPPTRRLTAACSATELLRNVRGAHYEERPPSVKRRLVASAAIGRHCRSRPCAGPARAARRRRSSSGLGWGSGSRSGGPASGNSARSR